MGDPSDTSKDISLGSQCPAQFATLGWRRRRPLQLMSSNIGALIITYTILGAPYYNYSIMGPKTLF